MPPSIPNTMTVDTKVVPKLQWPDLFPTEPFCDALRDRKARYIIHQPDPMGHVSYIRNVCCKATPFLLNLSVQCHWFGRKHNHTRPKASRVTAAEQIRASRQHRRMA